MTTVKYLKDSTLDHLTSSSSASRSASRRVEPVRCKPMRLSCLVVALALTSPSAHASDYPAGYCDGWNAAAQAVLANRDYYRHLSGAPNESHTTTLSKIYRQPWLGPTAPWVTTQPPGLPRVGPDVVDSIDLYLVIPELKPGQRILLPSGEEIGCP